MAPRRSWYSAVLRMRACPLAWTIDEMMTPEKTPLGTARKNRGRGVSGDFVLTGWLQGGVRDVHVMN